MKFARVTTNDRQVLLPLEVECFGMPYQELFKRAKASGYEVWTAYRQGCYSNLFQGADQERFNARDWWGEIVHDMIRGCGDGVEYVSNARTDGRKRKEFVFL